MKFGRTKTEILNHFSLIQSQLELSEERIAALEAELRAARQEAKLAVELRDALKELREWHKGEYQSNQLIDAMVDALLARAESVLNPKEPA